MIRQPKDKILLKLFNKKVSVVQNPKFRGTIKITKFRRYHRYNPLEYPTYSHILDYQFEVEIKGEVFGRLYFEDEKRYITDWHNSSVVTNRTFSKIRFNKIVKHYFILDEVVKTSNLFGMRLTKWDIKISKITWA